MDSIPTDQKPHVVVIPFPAQGHMNPMLDLAKLLHFHGFHITFVTTENCRDRLLKSRGPSALDSLPDFRYETIPDGIPSSTNVDAQDLSLLCDSTRKNCLIPFRQLLSKLNDTSTSCVPPVSRIIADVVMGFTLDVAQELGIPEVLFWTASACGFMGYFHYKHLMDSGLVPFKDDTYLTNGFLDTPVEPTAGLSNLRLRDLPTFMRTSNPDDTMLNFCNLEAQRASMASAVIVNTLDDLERPVLDAMESVLALPVYTVGPLGLLSRQLVSESPVASMGMNLWKEDSHCIQWLNGRAAGSVVYVNFGSAAVINNAQLVEFAWGLADSGLDFLWILRDGLVKGSAVLPPEFEAAIGERGFLASWCPQEEVLSHPAVGLFLTHNGWNSTLQSVTAGVPMLCWPCFAEQPTNCRYACTEWGVGMEIVGDVKREVVGDLIKNLMGGEGEGEKMRRRAAEWKESAATAIGPGGNSTVNLDKLVNHVLCSSQHVATEGSVSI